MWLETSSASLFISGDISSHSPALRPRMRRTFATNTGLAPATGSARGRLADIVSLTWAPIPCGGIVCGPRPRLPDETWPGGSCAAASYGKARQSVGNSIPPCSARFDATTARPSLAREIRGIIHRQRFEPALQRRHRIRRPSGRGTDQQRPRFRPAAIQSQALARKACPPLSRGSRTTVAPAAQSQHRDLAARRGRVRR